MDRLRQLLLLNPHLLGSQPVFEGLIEDLNEHQAERLANMLIAYLLTLPGGRLPVETAPTFH